MNITIFEACRSPEIEKETEGLILSQFFKEHALDYVLYSNDGIWPDRVIISRELIERRLSQPTVNIVHLAMHGLEQGLALNWSNAPERRNRVVIDLLTPDEIRAINGWQGKLIVSGACNSALIAQAFLDAGAAGIIAPREGIPWPNLGNFFRLFYTMLFAGKSASKSLAEAKVAFPEYNNFVYLKAKTKNFKTP